jgi:hypothetical protein
MSNNPIPPFVPGSGRDDDPSNDEVLDTDGTVMGDGDRPLDTDLDDDDIDSAAADERAATEGTVGEQESR